MSDPNNSTPESELETTSATELTASELARAEAFKTVELAGAPVEEPPAPAAPVSEPGPEPEPPSEPEPERVPVSEPDPGACARASAGTTCGRNQAGRRTEGSATSASC